MDQIQNQVNPSLKSEAELKRELIALRDEADQLKERRIRILSELERAKKEKETLEAELLSEFGTTDIQELERLLRDKAQKNQDNVHVYRQEIKEMRSEIERVNEELTRVA